MARVHPTGALTLGELDVANGFSSNSNPGGGCIYSQGSLTLENVTVRGCRLQYHTGAAIHSSSTGALVLRELAATMASCRMRLCAVCRAHAGGVMHMRVMHMRVG